MKFDTFLYTWNLLMSSGLSERRFQRCTDTRTDLPQFAFCVSNFCCCWPAPSTFPSIENYDLDDHDSVPLFFDMSVP